MRGYLILGLVGETIARGLITEHVPQSEAVYWLETWSRIVWGAGSLLPGNAEATATSLCYHLRTAQQLALVADDGPNDE